MFLIKGWTQTCVQNLIKIPPAQSPRTICTAWPLAWPRTVDALADHRPQIRPVSGVCLSKREILRPRAQTGLSQNPRAQHLTFAPYEVSIKTGRAAPAGNFFPTSIWFNIFPPAHPDWDMGQYQGWGSCRENFNRCINTGAYLDHFPPG